MCSYFARNQILNNCVQSWGNMAGFGHLASSLSMQIIWQPNGDLSTVALSIFLLRYAENTNRIFILYIKRNYSSKGLQYGLRNY